MFQCTTDNLFVARNGQERTELGGGILLRPPVEERASLRYSTSCGDLTRPRDESVLRRECVLSLLSLITDLSSLSLLSVGWRTGATVARVKQFVLEDKEFFRLLQTYAWPRKSFRIEQLTSRSDSLSHGRI